MHRRLAEQVRQHLGELEPATRVAIEPLLAAVSELERDADALAALASQLSLLVVMDRRGQVCSVHGSSAPQRAGRVEGLEDLLPLDVARRVRAAAEAGGAGDVTVIEYAVDSDDSERHYEARVGATGDLLVVTVRDVTDAVHATTAQLQRVDQEARTEALLELAYAASHDLRVPLRHIANLAEWLDEDVGEDIGEDARETLGLLRSNVAKMDELLSALLEYARLGQGNVELEEIDLASCVAEVVAMLPTDGFTVEVTGLPTITTARSPFERVMLNLIANALKHHDGEQGTITVRGEIEGKQLHVAVADDGPGIPEKQHVRVFQMFKKLNTNDNRGSGMGLALVKKVVQQAGGRIWLANNQPRGSVFHFTWPLAWPGAEPTREEPVRSRRVLVVDDSALARELSRRMLLRRGFDVVEAASVAAALALLAEQPVDAVLTDLNMPGTDGYALIETIRKDRALSTLPVFVLTSEPSPSHADHAARVGATGYLVKPIRASQLAARLEQALAATATG